MAYNATIASQISRISLARDVLRTKGIELGLNVPVGSYWDDNSDKEVATSAAALLKATDQIDKVAAAFNEINLYPQSEINVPILLKKNGTTIVSKTESLAPGFYSGAVIKPFITVEEEEDFVIDVQSKTVTLSAKTATITPDSGYNYLDSVTYTVADGAINTAPTSYDNSGVTVNVKTAGWLAAGDTQKVTVDTSTMSKKVGSGSASALDSGDSIAPSATADTTITISKGIYGSNRTITIQSVKSQTSGNAVAADILEGKVAWVNGEKVTGSMTNFTNKSTAAGSLVDNSGKLAIKPSATGYYNNTTTVTTDIVYNPVRVFNTTAITTAVTETMGAQTYYETIPAGYYAAPITRTITVQDAVGAMAVDYTNHKVRLNVSTAGWIDNGDVVDVAINAGPATYVAKLADATQYTVAAESNAYLTSVTIDNTAIYNALSEI